MAYGYCDSCQKFVYRQNDESFCERTGSYTNVNSKCKQYLPDMTYFEWIKSIDISSMSELITQLIEATLLEYDVIDIECCKQKHSDTKAFIREVLERKVSEDDKA